jgi:hypothetical protein
MEAWQMRGASAGALTATLAACHVDVDHAFDCAERLAREYRLCERSLGLTGAPRHAILDIANERSCNSAEHV